MGILDPGRAPKNVTPPHQKEIHTNNMWIKRTTNPDVFSATNRIHSLSAKAIQVN